MKPLTMTTALEWKQGQRTLLNITCPNCKVVFKELVPTLADSVRVECSHCHAIIQLPEGEVVK